MADFDAVVVGGGPSGSTAAYYLARLGARVALFDRAEFPRDKPCGGGITGRAWAQAPEPAVALEAYYPYQRSEGGACLPEGWKGVLGLELGSIDGGYGWSFPKADHFNVGCGGFHTQGRSLRPHLNRLADHYGVTAP